MNKKKLIILSLIFLITLPIFAKRDTQKTCGLGSGGNNSSSYTVKYQEISPVSLFKIQVFSKKIIGNTSNISTQFKRDVNLQLTPFPTSSKYGSEFAIISIENSSE